MDVRTAVAQAEGQDPAVGLRAVVVLRRLADDVERTHVTAARRAGWSWQQVADALGVSRQAVHKKHRRC
jgi:transcriptional regulator of acetoin/glycerol metabolism